MLLMTARPAAAASPLRKFEGSGQKTGLAPYSPIAATESAMTAMVELWNVPAAKSPAAARTQALT
jgi:hypothetical protein